MQDGDGEHLKQAVILYMNDKECMWFKYRVRLVATTKKGKVEKERKVRKVEIGSDPWGCCGGRRARLGSQDGERTPRQAAATRG